MHGKEEQLRYCLALLRAPGIGPVSLRKLLEAVPDLSGLFNQSGRLVLKKKEIPIDWASVDRDLQWSEKPGCTILIYNQPDYPPLLKEIDNFPPVLFVRGQVKCLCQRQISIVGSRTPSFMGRDLAQQFARDFSNMGFGVTSGLALGIDAAAHQGALMGTMGTIAVLGNGLDSIYPKDHLSLAQEIIERGALVSEFPLGVMAMPKHFPRRNRIISGLALGTLVVEAALKSGSLITARLAAEQGRDVFAIPGSINSPLTKGCHHLIREGAKLVETPQDVLEELGTRLDCIRPIEIKGSKSSSIALPDLSEDLFILLNQIDCQGITVDGLVEKSGLTVGVVSSMLLELELQGCVKAVPGGYARVLGLG